MNTPIWNIMHINISITTIRTFIIPTIFNRQLFVIVSENFHRGYMLILRNDSNKILAFNKFSMLCGATAIHFDQLVFALFKNTFSYITNPSKLITPLISVTRLKLNKSVEQFHRGYILHQASAEVNAFLHFSNKIQSQDIPPPF